MQAKAEAKKKKEVMAKLSKERLNRRLAEKKEIKQMVRYVDIIEKGSE